MKTNITNIIIFLLIIGSLLSCKNRKVNDYVEIVEYWKNREIKIPSSLIFKSVIDSSYCFTVDSLLKSQTKKILIYTDSMGCTECKLHLPFWKRFMEELDSLSEDKIPLLFIYNPKDSFELAYIFRINEFNYPICFDTKDSLNISNGLPKSQLFQTLLLDDDNKVIVIGNPIYNSKIKKLFIKHILNSKAIDLPNNMKCDIIASPAEINIGDIKLGDTKGATVVLSNHGNSTFLISKIETSCDCTSVVYKTDSIPPNSSINIEIIQKGDYIGELFRTISIYGNIKENTSINIVINGMVTE